MKGDKFVIGTSSLVYVDKRGYRNFHDLSGQFRETKSKK